MSELSMERWQLATVLRAEAESVLREMSSRKEGEDPVTRSHFLRERTPVYLALCRAVDCLAPTATDEDMLRRLDILERQVGRMTALLQEPLPDSGVRTGRRW